jgi:hypothetical protein
MRDFLLTDQNQAIYFLGTPFGPTPNRQCHFRQRIRVSKSATIGERKCIGRPHKRLRSKSVALSVRLHICSDEHPILGPVLWALSLQNVHSLPCS